VPAPAVIPAPKAYINAVAVKGFVVELWAARGALVCPVHLGLVTQPSSVRERTFTSKQETREWFLS
jgi:hypothetical protein